MTVQILAQCVDVYLNLMVTQCIANHVGHVVSRDVKFFSRDWQFQGKPSKFVFLLNVTM